MLGTTAMLGACVDPAAVRATAPPDDPFLAGLRTGYLDLADARTADGLALAASFYAYKARAASRGDAIGPERFDDWTVDPKELTLLVVARARLATSIAEGQRKVGAGHAAEAQVMFDCWLERQEAGEFIHPCRERFWRALGRLDDDLARQRSATPAGRPLSSLPSALYQAWSPS